MTKRIINKLIRFVLTVIPGVLLTISISGIHAFSQNTDSLKYEILLTAKMADRNHIYDNFIPSLDVTSNRLILLSTNRQFYYLGWGGIKPYMEQVSHNIEDFAFTPDSLLMVIQNREICSFDSSGNLKRLFKLPGEKMGISSGKYVMYVYDRNPRQFKNTLYVIARGGKYARLLDVPKPIMAVVEMDNSVLFATQNGLFSFNPKSKALHKVAAIAGDQEISSIAVDSIANRIYFSTENSIYTVKDSNTVIISNAFGGVLRFFNGGLIVFNTSKKSLIRITGIENIIASVKPRGKPTTTPPAMVSSGEPVQQPKNVIVPEPTKTKTQVTQPEPVKEAIHVPANTIRAEKFISNASGNLEKGKSYVLKKDYSQPMDLLNNFPDGSVLKLVGSDPSQIKSWKVIKPSDGATALIDSKLYIYFEQAHVWAIKLSQ